MDKGGIEAAGIITEYLLNKDHENIALQLDVKNAYNSPLHGKLLSIIQTETPFLTEICKLTMGQKSGKTIFNGEEIDVERGVHQGGTLSTAIFCIGLHAVINEIIEKYSTVKLVNISDNIVLIGKPKTVIKMSKEIKTALSNKLGLQLANEKSMIYGFGEKYCENDIKEAKRRGYVWIPYKGGVTFAGTPIGSDNYKHSIFMKKINEVSRDIDKITDFYKMTRGRWHHSRQALTYMLRNCIAQKCTFLCRVMDPTVTEKGCKIIDTKIINCLTEIIDVTRNLPNSDSEEMNIMKEKFFLPIKNGGFGLYSIDKAREASFYGCMMDVNTLVYRYDNNISIRNNTSLKGNFRTFKELSDKFNIYKNEDYGTTLTFKTQNIVLEKINEELKLKIYEKEEKTLDLNTSEGRAKVIQYKANLDKQASKWINLHPGSYLYRLNNTEFRHSIAFRMGIHLAMQRQFCLCGKPFDSLGLHHHTCTYTCSHRTDIHEKVKKIIQNELQRAHKFGKYSIAADKLKEPRINDFVQAADCEEDDVDKCNPFLKGENRYGDAGIIDRTDNPDEPQIYIYDVGQCSLNCQTVRPNGKDIDFGLRQNGDGARHVKYHKEDKYKKEFTYGRKLHIKILGFDTGTGCIDSNTRSVLKQIAKFVCCGQLPGEEFPDPSVIAMRHQYLLKQISVAFQKWRSNLFNDSLKFFSCDLHPGYGPFRFDCRYSIPASRPHPNESYNIAINRSHALEPIFFSGEDQNNSEMINNIVNLTSSYTELVDNL